MITYDHSGEHLEHMINELWEHEINYIAMFDVIEMAKMSFIKDLESRRYEDVVKHYNDTIGR